MAIDAGGGCDSSRGCSSGSTSADTSKEAASAQSEAAKAEAAKNETAKAEAEKAAAEKAAAEKAAAEKAAAEKAAVAAVTNAPSVQAAFGVSSFTPASAPPVGMPSLLSHTPIAQQQVSLQTAVATPEVFSPVSMGATSFTGSATATVPSVSSFTPATPQPSGVGSRLSSPPVEQQLALQAATSLNATASMLSPTPVGPLTPLGPPATTGVGYLAGQPRNITLHEIAPGLSLQPIPARDFLAMQHAASLDGISLTVNEAFRTWEQQRALYEAYQQNRGNPANRPGHSNHQMGRSVDINVGRVYSSREYQWLAENAPRYNFRNDVPGEPHHWTHQGEFHTAPTPGTGGPRRR
jgi:hypothetical protein